MTATVADTPSLLLSYLESNPVDRSFRKRIWERTYIYIKYKILKALCENLSRANATFSRRKFNVVADSRELIYGDIRRCSFRDHFYERRAGENSRSLLYCICDRVRSRPDFFDRDPDLNSHCDTHIAHSWHCRAPPPLIPRTPIALCRCSQMHRRKRNKNTNAQRRRNVGKARASSSRTTSLPKCSSRIVFVCRVYSPSRFFLPSLPLFISSPERTIKKRKRKKELIYSPPAPLNSYRGFKSDGKASAQEHFLSFHFFFFYFSFFLSWG